nr:hypothetical protein [Streptomyces sp. NRRL F-525]
MACARYIDSETSFASSILRPGHAGGRQVGHRYRGHLGRDPFGGARTRDGDQASEDDPVEDLVEPARRALGVEVGVLAVFGDRHRRAPSQWMVARDQREG